MKTPEASYAQMFDMNIDGQEHIHRWLADVGKTPLKHDQVLRMRSEEDH